MTNRKEISARLREAGAELDKNAPRDVNGAAQSVLFELFEATSVRDSNSYSDAFTRLADLIDPTCEGVEEREDDGIDAPPRYTSHCGNCGQMWDETSGIPRFPMYCPNCGARVVRGRLNPWVVKY